MNAKKIDTRALYARGEQQQWSDDKYFISNYFAIIYFTLKAVKTAAKWNMHDSQSQYTSCFLSHCSSKKKESSQGTIEKRLRWMLIPWLNSLSIRSSLYLHSMYPLGDFVEKKNILFPSLPRSTLTCVSDNTEWGIQTGWHTFIHNILWGAFLYARVVDGMKQTAQKKSFYSFPFHADVRLSRNDTLSPLPIHDAKARAGKYV